ESMTVCGGASLAVSIATPFRQGLNVQRARPLNVEVTQYYRNKHLTYSLRFTGSYFSEPKGWTSSLQLEMFMLLC
ncbi:MAG: hypothetical protein ACRCW3_03460, partial [Metamycoplasmataceae bacterium]